MSHFEPLSKELNARRFLNQMEHMDRHSTTKTYNEEFSRHILLIPSLFAPEQIFHYSQQIKSSARTEEEWSEFSSLQETMVVADKMENLFSSSYSPFG